MIPSIVVLQNNFVMSFDILRPIFPLVRGSNASIVFDNVHLWWFHSVLAAHNILHPADLTKYRAWASNHEYWVLQLMLMHAQVVPKIFSALDYRNGSIFHRQS